MTSPRSKIPGTPWWCVEDLETVKKAVEHHTRSIEQLEMSLTGYQKQHQDLCSSVHSRYASLEAFCEQLSSNVQNLLLSDTQQQFRPEQTAHFDHLFAQVNQERVRETTEINERLERLESKLDQSLSIAASAVAKTHSEDVAVPLDGTLTMLVDIKGSLEQTHQAIAAACTQVQSKTAIATTSIMASSFQSEAVPPACTAASQHERTKLSLVATPRVQRRRASVGERSREPTRGSSFSASPCLAQATGAVSDGRKRLSRQALLTQPVRQTLRSTGRTQSLSKGHSVAALRRLSDSPRIYSGRSGKPCPGEFSSLSNDPELFLSGDS